MPKKKEPAVPSAEQEKPKGKTERRDLSEKVDKRRRRRFKGEDGRYHWTAAKSDSKATDKLQAVKKQYGPGGIGAAADTTVKEYANHFLATKESAVAYSSYRMYKSTINEHIVAHIGRMKIASIKPSHIQLAISKSAKLGERRKAFIVATIKSLFGAAETDGLLYRNPTTGYKVSQPKKEARRALTAEEAAITEDLRHDKRFLPLTVMYEAGTRVGETYGLQWKFIDFDRKRIIIDQQLHMTEDGPTVDRDLKRENSRRSIPMSEALEATLRPLRGLPEAYLFPGMHMPWLSVSAATQQVAKMLEDAGLENITAHYLRHDFATRLYKGGVDIKEAAAVLGDDVTTMLKIYTHIQKDLSEESAEKIRAALSKKPEVAKRLPANHRKR